MQGSPFIQLPLSLQYTPFVAEYNADNARSFVGRCVGTGVSVGWEVIVGLGVGAKLIVGLGVGQNVPMEVPLKSHKLSMSVILSDRADT